jgi:hypothetical protein
VVVARWEGELDKAQLAKAMAGDAESEV